MQEEEDGEEDEEVGVGPRRIWSNKQLHVWQS